MKPDLIFISAPLPKGADRKMRGLGRGPDPLNIFIDPLILDNIFNMGGQLVGK